MENFTNTTNERTNMTISDSVGDTCEILCDVYCAIDIVLITVGVIVNGIVVWRVARDIELRTPTFVAIASLAVADLGFMIAYFVAMEIECPPHIPAYESGETVILAFYMTMWVISATHILFLSVIRFILILTPLKSLTYLTVRKTIFMSVGIWIVGIILGIVAGILFVLKQLAIVDSISVITMFIIVILGSYFIPLVATIILHAIKLKEVYKAMRSDLPEQVRQMSLMVTIILLLFTILPLPQVVTLFIICFSDDIGFLDNPGVEWSLSFGLLLNSCANPFVYAIFSRLFRKSLRKQFCQCKSLEKNHTDYGSNRIFQMSESSYH